MTGSKRTRKTISKNESETILRLWLTGAGKIPEIANAMSRSKSTIYLVLMQHGVWPGVDDYTKARPLRPYIKKPRKVVVEEPKITMVEAPKRTFWDRVKDFFA